VHMVIVCFLGWRGWAYAGHSAKKGGLLGDNVAKGRSLEGAGRRSLGKFA